MEQRSVHESLEQDIAELAREIEKRPEAGREAIRESIGERIFEPATPGDSASVEPSRAPERQPAGKEPLPNYAENVPAETKLRVEELIDLAWHKGLAPAIRKVRRSDPLTMDLFHDAITVKLYEEFKRRGIVQ